jgi:hypothetical protein
VAGFGCCNRSRIVTKESGGNNYWRSRQVDDEHRCGGDERVSGCNAVIERRDVPKIMALRIMTILVHAPCSWNCHWYHFVETCGLANQTPWSWRCCNPAATSSPLPFPLAYTIPQSLFLLLPVTALFIVFANTQRFS